MNKIYFISDTHFGHQFISKKRGFVTVEEHDNFLIDNWNKTVDNGDRIYILGDFIWSDVEPETILKRLNGQKYLIQGNHDRINNHTESKFLRYVNWIKDYFVLKIKVGANIPSIKIVLFHYPIEVWDSDHYGSFHLFGHIHEKCRHKEMSELPNRFNVGADVINYTPIEWEEILKKLKETGMWKKDYREELKMVDLEEQ